MRRCLPGLLFLAASCAGGHSTPRGGELTVTRAHLSTGDSLDAYAAFFRPPGPPDPEEGPHDSCVVQQPTPTPTGTPEVGWKDAGATLTLSGGSTSLTLDRFAGSSGEIFYLGSSGADPASIQPSSDYSLSIDGSTAPNGVAKATLARALRMPRSVGLYGPDFANAPATISRDVPLPISWDPGDASDRIAIRLAVIGTGGGSITLSCGTPDDGSFQIAPDQLAFLPSGPGTLTVTRTRMTRVSLSGAAALESRASLVEGGAIVLP